MTKAETFRRLVFGELKRIYRSRYGPTLPDDDAGRDDLELLLLHVAECRERRAIEIWAPWMLEPETALTLATLPARRPSTVEISERLRLTNAEREAYGCRILPPVDMTEAELEEQRKAKKRVRQAERRRNAGAVPRAVYVATSKTRLKPWQLEHMSRAKWYRVRRETSVKPTNSLSRPQTCLTTRGRRASRKRTPPPHHKRLNGRATRGPP